MSIMDFKLFVLFVVVGTATCQSEEGGEGYQETVTTPEPEQTEDEENKNFFINKVYQLGSEISRNLVIHDNRVVYSPFAVVNALSILNNDEKLVNGFESAYDYLTKENPLNATIISTGYTKNETLLNKSYKTLTLKKLIDGQDVNDLLQQSFLNLTNFSHENSTTVDTHDTLKVNTTEDTVLLTGLGVEALWENPFHPRYSKKQKFYLNSTHVVKSKFMNNIGFYKYAELDGFDADAIAVPLKSPRTYVIFIKPHNVNNLEQLNTQLESVTNFTDLFKKLRTKRVQLSLPRVLMDSQFPINLTTTTTTLQVSSLKISYTGVYNNFHAPVTGLRPIKFTRLRRRKDDILFKLNQPFIFHVYDAQLSGFLLSGLVLNPDNEPTLYEQQPQLMLDPEIKLAKQLTNDVCLVNYSKTRKVSSIQDNIIQDCHANYSMDLMGDGQFLFNYEKDQIRKFYLNELDYSNKTFYEVVMRVRYLAYAPFDCRVVQVRNGTHSLYILLPNERSGLSLIEEGLDHVQFGNIVCQMREINLRLRLPNLNANGLKFEGKKVKLDKKKNDNLVEYERGGRAKKNRKYRKLNIDRPFVYILTEELLTNGGYVAMGRINN